MKNLISRLLVAIYVVRTYKTTSSEGRYVVLWNPLSWVLVIVGAVLTGIFTAGKFVYDVVKDTIDSADEVKWYKIAIEQKKQEDIRKAAEEKEAKEIKMRP